MTVLSCLTAHRAWLLALGAAVLAVSCGDDSPPTVPNTPAPSPPRAVSLTVTPSVVTLTVGETAILTAQGLDSARRHVSTAVEWISEKPDIATVGRSDGRVTALAGGVTTIIAVAGGLQATAVVTVRVPVPTLIRLSASELEFALGTSERITSQVFDQDGRFLTSTVTWTSQNTSIASVGADGLVTGMGVGSTIVVATAGAARVEVAVRVQTANFLRQWATGATASTQYENFMWSANQALGAPNVAADCNDEWRSWASLDNTTVEWLELSYDQPVRPTEIRKQEVYAPGSIVKVEVKDLAGQYHQVYSATPAAIAACLHTRTIAISDVTAYVSSVRVTIDQSVIRDWNEIDAVRLTGYRPP